MDLAAAARIKYFAVCCGIFDYCVFVIDNTILSIHFQEGIWFNIAYSPAGLYANEEKYIVFFESVSNDWHIFLIKAGTQKKRVLTAGRKAGKRNEITTVRRQGNLFPICRDRGEN